MQFICLFRFKSHYVTKYIILTNRFKKESDTYSLRPELSNIMSRILSDIEASYTDFDRIIQKKILVHLIIHLKYTIMCTRINLKTCMYLMTLLLPKSFIVLRNLATCVVISTLCIHANHYLS